MLSNLLNCWILTFIYFLIILSRPAFRIRNIIYLMPITEFEWEKLILVVINKNIAKSMKRQLKDKVLGYLKSAKAAKRQGPRIFEECQGR